MKKQYLLGVVITINCLLIACNGIKAGNLSLSNQGIRSSIRLTVSPAPETKANLQLSPARLFVSRKKDSQQPPRLILKVTGLSPGTKMYWSYRYQCGPRNPDTKLPFSPFSCYENHSYNYWEDSTIADHKGESMVLFKATTYAGDRFQFGIGLKEYLAGFKNESNLSIRFRNSSPRSKIFEVWKRIRFERPKVLKRVRFPQTTWKYIKDNLEQINIECLGNFTPIELNPSDSSIFYYFYTFINDPLRGRGKDPRYGPEGYGPIEVMLSRLNIIYSDEKPSTISLFIFGTTSKNKDLINNHSEDKETPIPVDYHYHYSPEEMDLIEWSAYGTGSSMAGKSPAIFIWSDFWWLASKGIDVSHAKSLARVILHEIGHHLLMFKSGDHEGILDSTGHPVATLVTQKSIMTGSGIIRFNKGGGSFVSRNSIRRERRFIENPRWNPKIEMLIRRDFLPSEG